MQNKLYTILANLFNEIKAFKNGDPTIGAAVKRLVDNSSEVTKARGPYLDLDSRVGDIQSKINSINLDIADIDNKIYAVKNDVEGKIPKFNTAIIHDDKKEIIVSLDDRVLHKEDILTIHPGNSATLGNSDQYTISKAYMNTLDSVATTKTIVFQDDGRTAYNKSINTIDTTNNLIIANGIDRLYELPLTRANIFSTQDYDACIIDNFAIAIADYNSPTLNNDGTINYTNHFVNVFNRKGVWFVKRSYVSFVINFNEAIELAKVFVDFSTSSSFKRCIIEYTNDGITWSKITDSSSSIDFTIATPILVSGVKISVNALDGTINRDITIKSVQLYSTCYNEFSDTITNTDPITLDMYNNLINIKTKSPSDESKFILTKYVLSNLLNTADGRHYTYIPNTYNLMPNDFYDSRGYRNTQSQLKNNVKLNVASKVLFYPLEKNYTPQTSITGTLGNCSITKQFTFSKTNAWKPYTNDIYVIYISINGSLYQIPLDINNINKNLIVTVGGVQLRIIITILSNNVVMAYVSQANLSQNIVVDSVRVDILSSFNFVESLKDHGGGFNSSWSTFNVGSSVTNTTDTPNPMLGLIKMYILSSDYYIYNYNWDFSWGGRTTTVTKEVENGITACIIPYDSYTGTDYISTAVETPMYRTTIEKRGCSLPVSVYLGCNGASQLQNAIANTSRIENIVNSPVFSYEQEYVSKTFISNSEIVSIVPQQTSSITEDIQYSISFDGYNYFYINEMTAKWAPYLGQGMSYDTVLTLNDNIINNIRNGSEWIYIKVKIISPSASVQNITINFDKYRFVLIDKNEILEKGMSKRVIESITPDILTDSIFKVSPLLHITSVAKSLYPSYRYKMAGYDICDYKNVQWQEIDNINIKEYLLGNNALMYKNLGTKPYYVKVIRNVYKNQTAVVSANDTIKDVIEIVQSEQVNIKNSIKTLIQNVQLIHDSLIQNGTVPSVLPDVVLPSIKNYDIPLLASKEIYRIKDIEDFRGIQMWEEQKNFIGVTERLDFNSTTSSLYNKVFVNIGDDGVIISSDYDKDNPYLYNESGTIVDKKHAVYPNYDLSISEVPFQNGNVLSILENGGSADISSDLRQLTDAVTENLNAWRATKYSTFWSYNSVWKLPGEDRRWVDIIIDFRENIWLSSLQNIDFGILGNSSGTWYLANWQITTFSSSYDNLEYIDFSKHTGNKQRLTIPVNKEMRYLRIRCEVPYYQNRGADMVSFTEMDMYFCPTHYIHNTEGYVYNATPINTSMWNTFSKIDVDRFIDHNPCEMKFYLSDSDTASIWKSWNGTKWNEYSTITLQNAMSIETLLSLTSVQLNQLIKGSLYICAVMKTTDIWKTPVLRSITLHHDSFSTKTYYDLADPRSLDIKYSEQDKEVIITNTSSGSKKLRAVLL